MTWSIRRRLTLWNTLALSVLLVGLAALVYALMAKELEEFMTSPEEAGHVLGMLRAVLAVAVPLMLVAAGGLAYWLAGRSLAPLDALDRATRQVTARSLDQRLPVVNPGDELGRLTATINDMIARLEGSFEELRRFTAHASHELRTPLAVLRSEAEVALRQDLSAEQLRGVLASVLEECGRLARLSEQLLALARQDRGAALKRAGAVDLGGLARDVVESLRPLAEDKGLWLRCAAAAPAVVEGDANLLRQVLINLIDNALKYTARGGVDVTAETEGNSVRLAVADTGEGIAPEHLGRVFDRFYRVDKARSRELGGSGLGLSITRGVIEAHGGTIAVESTLGRGSTFTVTLPRSRGAPS
jgi:heavy metal sensor kinase